MNRLAILGRQTIRRRPLSTFAATTSLTALGYANYIEYNANKNDKINVTTAAIDTIPRNYYNPNSIASYWEQRPISIIKRLLNVAYELGPVVGEYGWKFHIKPTLWSSVDTKVEGQAAILEEKQKKHELESELAQKLRVSLTKLGPTFVKIGQQLSIRPDLVSPTVLYELQRLCDAVPPFHNVIAMKVLAAELVATKQNSHEAVSSTKTDMNESEIHDTILSVFEEMPKLVASASLGQVYKATIRSSGKDSDNEQVAIKIQRPDIFKTVTLDLFLLVTYGKCVDKICSILTNQIPYHEIFINNFAQGSYMELNYVNEAENQIYFRNELHARFHGGGSHNSNESNDKKQKMKKSIFRPKTNTVEKVIVPKVYEEYTTQRILVSEWIQGIPLAQAPPDQIRELIPVGVELFLCQLLDIGRFHADPHPGNLYVTKSKVDGKTPTLCLLDFGLIANVSEDARNNMTQAIVNLLQGDYDTLISRDAKELGFLPHDMDVTELKPVLKTILKEGLVDAGSNLHDRRRNLMAISNELNEVFFQHPFSVPPFFALVTRGLGLLEGIALTGDPSFDIFKASYPYAKRRAIETFTVKDYGKIMMARRLTSTR